MSSVARRYAKALFALATEAGTAEATGIELERLAATAADPALRDVLRSPMLSGTQRNALAGSLIAELKLSDLLRRFALLLADQQRLDSLPMIDLQFRRLVDESLGRLRATIRTPSALDPHQQNALVATFSKLTGKHIQADIVVDPELLGGVVVEVGGRVYDGSVRTQLDLLTKQLAGTASL